MTRPVVEEILESLWTVRESGGDATAAEVLSRAHGDAGAADLEEAVAVGLLTRVDGGVAFTAPGEEAARSLVRRHRLAERLLTDVLQVGEDGLESSACGFEHILSPEVTDAICTLLGHPTVCPHRHPIPPGPCCAKLSRESGQVVRRLSDVAAGERVAIVFIASEKDRRLMRLGSFGVHPGAVVRIAQRRPSFILEVDQTSLAVEKDVADGIYVRRPPESAGKEVRSGEG